MKEFIALCIEVARVDKTQALATQGFSPSHLLLELGPKLIRRSPRGPSEFSPGKHCSKKYPPQNIKRWRGV